MVGYKALNTNKEKNRVYLNDHNEARSLNDIGMREEDFTMLQMKGIVYR